MQVKASTSTLDYPIMWTLAAGETISTSTWSVLPSETGGIAASDDAIDDDVTSCLLSDGLAGHVYEVTNTITTDQGRTDARTITFRIGPVEALS